MTAKKKPDDVDTDGDETPEERLARFAWGDDAIPRLEMTKDLRDAVMAARERRTARKPRQ